MSIIVAIRIAISQVSGSEGKVGWGDELAGFRQWLLKQLLLLHSDNDGAVGSSQAAPMAQRQQHTHPMSAA